MARNNLTLIDVIDRLDKLETKMTTMFNAKFDDHEKRIRANESFVSRAGVYGMLIVTIISSSIATGVNYFFKKFD